MLCLLFIEAESKGDAVLVILLKVLRIDKAFFSSRCCIVNVGVESPENLFIRNVLFRKRRGYEGVFIFLLGVAS